MKQVLVICGPTASGKTALSVELAKRFHTEIISGDSIQVYKGLDIGSGKVTSEEMQGIPHHLIDILEPNEPYSAKDFQSHARALIDQIDFPIIAGGTGLYLKACLYDYDFPEEEEDDTVERLEKKSDEELYQTLLSVDPKQAEKIHPNNRRRIIRALTIYYRMGKPMSETIAEQSHDMIYDVFFAGCTMERSLLYERIDLRVDRMFETGLSEEVERLIDSGVTFNDPAMKGIGYREFEGFYRNEMTVDEVKAKIKLDSHRYAKRQYTWLNHQFPVHWFDVTKPDVYENVYEEVRRWKK